MRDAKHIIRMHFMNSNAILVLVALAIPVAASNVVTKRASAHTAVVSRPTELHAADIAAARRRDDLAAMQTFRPGYPF